MLSTTLAPYRRILARPGTLRFSLAAVVARLPIAMVGLGIVLLVEGETGSYGLAGSVAAVGLVANAAAAVVQGRLVDRLGQSRVLPAAIAVWGVALALLMWSVQADWALGTTYGFAAVSGAALPGVGSCVRARWAHVLDDAGEVQTAFALEAVLDEAVFMVGPILATVLATAVHPVVGLSTALVVGVVFTLAFSAQRATEPPPHPVARSADSRAAMPWAVVLPLTAACLALGAMFGGAEVTTVAFADERGATGRSGLLLAVWAAGSLISGVVTGAIAWRRGPVVRLRIGAAALIVAMAPLTLIDSMVLLGAVLFVGGFAIAPTLIATMSLAERSVPPSRLTEGMAFLHTGIVAGVAPGAALSGIVVDASGASSAYLVSVAAGAVALLASLATRAPAAALSDSLVDQ
jgi:MFS family permease